MTGAPTERNAKRISPNKASWGAGPQQREFREEIQQAKQVGVPKAIPLASEPTI
ncbi:MULTISPECIES: hypothetical protein [Staphylococcus]|uniref:hypothetical protein n=1 Tax=Staphylococcus TaxID=1279 RepID=UPI000AC19122|nr:MULTISPECIES: hypothetical protein [Staphylococcus]MCI2815108.1 hypothetical protein [Staphylococcus lugdunensis]MDU0965336.1 hypothetical protein [Staphylococcus lugdunensis]MDU1963830.1 hypothetical protein [Staphylococcus lugdunensis]MDU2320922.1 hypothetical protein [Staphylococcus lugdunensis]MDU2404433.1 hypothetical protein [Staphylococcus lugdunensis]